MKEEERKYAYWLCNLAGIGNRSIEKLLQICGGTPKKVYYAGEEKWKQILNQKQLESMKDVTEGWNVEAEYQKMVEKNIRFLVKSDENYPARLREIPDAPYGIFYKGKLPEEELLSVAIVGARDCTPYGSYVATELGKYLGERGVQVISGMARGIDGISQEAALSVGGTSFGVLGCGVDICYPAQNRELYERLQKIGGILSAYPPGESPKPQHFPQRNRIVSGLADVVVVIEARSKSGTLITVDMALEQGKEVYVVPGRITDRLSDGCNSLLKQGAGVLISPRDFFEEIGSMWEEKNVIFRRTKLDKESDGDRVVPIDIRKYSLSAEMREIYETLDFYPQSIEQIMEKLSHSYTVVQVNTLLVQLCMEKMAVQLSPGYFSR